jgi:hypothetical protein
VESGVVSAFALGTTCVLDRGEFGKICRTTVKSSVRNGYIRVKTMVSSWFK